MKAEIESWYCAGVPAQDSDLGMREIANLESTEEITKEVFDHAVSQKGLLHVPVMTGILERFDLKLAARRNRSFHYFLRKHLQLSV